MNRSERIYRTLLLAYPERTRLIFGEDMVQLFRDRMRDADSSLERGNVWFEVIADIAVTAPRERMARRRPTRLAEGVASEASRPLGPDLTVASLPLLLAALALLALPGFYRPMFDPRISILGLPGGVAMLILTGIPASFGILEARRGDFRDPQVQVIALAVLLALLIPIVLLGVLALQPAGWAIYAGLVTLFVLAARYRVVMLSLAIPYVIVLLFGPALILTMVNMRV